MPIKDVDGGLVWNNYNPSIFGQKMPHTEKKFYFGGSQVPTELGLTKQQYDGTGMSKCACRLKSVKKLPHLRK